jgi:hypothetical protein
MTQSTKTRTKILPAGQLVINLIKLKLRWCRNLNTTNEVIETQAVEQNLAYKRIIIVKGTMKRPHALKSSLRARSCQNLSEILFPIRDPIKEMSSLCIVTALEDFQGKSLFSHTNLDTEKKVFPEDQLSSRKAM